MKQLGWKEIFFLVSFCCGSIVLGLFLFGVTCRLDHNVRAQWATIKPLCVVCGKPAVRKTEGYYVVDAKKYKSKSPAPSLPPGIHSLPPGARRAWLCNNCAEPPKI